MKFSEEWITECKRWRGKVLTGPDGHWCNDWDGLPVDAFTPEYEACVCYNKTLFGRFCNWIFMIRFNRRCKREAGR